MKAILNFIVYFLSVTVYSQQFTMNADLRVRYEHRHGYGTLFNDTLKSADFINQRSRLILNYSSPKINLRVSPQNIRVWGDVVTNAKSDINNGLHEAWAEVMLDEKIGLKVGRQELNYDDARILGNVDWLMQARSHDALLLNIKTDSTSNLHFGLSYNANKESNIKENYAVPQYKTLQYLWYHKQFDHAGWSVLALNQAMPRIHKNEEVLDWNQTLGSIFTYDKNKFKGSLSGYFQTGKWQNKDLQAFYFQGDLNYKWATSFTAGAGIEYLSGTDQGNTDNKIESFNPWYGTNHKFNGYMDYFYVGNHINSVGLSDVFFNFQYIKKKWNLAFAPHYFSSGAQLKSANEKLNSYLGTELDFTISYKILDHVNFIGGYSQMLSTTSLEALKGAKNDTQNNWMYLAIHFNPNLINLKK